IKCSCGKGAIERAHTIRKGNHILYDDVQQRKECCYDLLIVGIDLTRMDSIIAGDTNDVERLLHGGRKTLLNERANVVVNVLARLAKFLTQQLNGEAQETSGSARRLCRDRCRFFVVLVYRFWHVRI